VDVVYLNQDHQDLPDPLETQVEMDSQEDQVNQGLMPLLPQLNPNNNLALNLANQHLMDHQDHQDQPETQAIPDHLELTAKAEVQDHQDPLVHQDPMDNQEDQDSQEDPEHPVKYMTYQEAKDQQDPQDQMDSQAALDNQVAMDSPDHQALKDHPETTEDQDLPETQVEMVNRALLVDRVDTGLATIVLLPVLPQDTKQLLDEDRRRWHSLVIDDGVRVSPFSFHYHPFLVVILFLFTIVPLHKQQKHCPHPTPLM